MGMLALLIGYYIVPNFLDYKRTLIAPPSVLVHAPLDGEEYPAGSIISSRSTGTGRNPLDRVELWIDGELIDEQSYSDDESNGLTTIHATIPVKITEGMHMLYWRVIDREGQIGQSLPITIIGTERLGGVETTTVEAAEGQTLQDIAEELGGEPDVLAKLNPNLGLDGLPGGTNVNVPKTPPGGQPPPQGGSIIVNPPPTGESIIVTDPLLPVDPIIDFGPLILLVANTFPSAPTDLEAGFEHCTIQLNWSDNADNEQAYQVWMKAGAGLPRLIATLESRRGTGNASYVFESPSFGIYGFWVEAVNGLGGQPSHVKWLFIDDTTCRDQQATGLEVEILDLNIGGFSGQLYCYISFEGNPERRIPEVGFFNDFVTDGGDQIILEGKGEIYLIPIPADDELQISGKCLGHLGTDVIELGTFNKSIPKIQWNGMRLEAQAGNIKLGYRIQPHGLEDPSGLYRYTDIGLKIPYIKSVEPMTERDPKTRSRIAKNITLIWGWPGEMEDISNFVIAMNHSMEYRWANKDDREILITLPSTCGNMYRFSIAGVAPGGARTEYSDWYEYIQPDCDYYAEVTFDTLEFTYANDGTWQKCDDLELQFDIGVTSVNRIWRKFGGFYGTDTDCFRTYHFIQYPFDKGAPGRGDSYTVLIEPSTSSIDFYIQFTDVDTWIVPWDWDSICLYKKSIHRPLEKWATYDEIFTDTCIGLDEDKLVVGEVNIKYRVKGFKTPNQ